MHRLKTRLAHLYPLVRVLARLAPLCLVMWVAQPQAQSTIPTPTLLTNDGGRLAWYHGAAHELIAFDAVVDEKQDTEVFLMNPDGSGRRCVTCGSSLRKGFVGQPAWHPDGEHLIIQVENDNSPHRLFNHMSWGFDNDLWIIRRDGSGAEKVWESDENGAALHPHFSDDGTLLVFAEHVPTRRGRLLLRNVTPGGGNPWDGWQIHLAKYNANAKGLAKLSDHSTITPNGSGFYETHGFTDDGRILYSHTDGGKAYVDDVFSARRDGSNASDLTNSPSTWDEHGQFSSRGDLAFISSRFDKSLQFPRDRPRNVKTELFLRRSGKTEQQLTDMNKRKGVPIAVSDFDFDRSGNRIAFQVATISGGRRPEIWMVKVE